MSQGLSVEAVRAYYPDNDAVHGFDHILRVLRMAERLADEEGADVEIVRAAALLHDAQEPRESENEPGSLRAEHHLSSADLARKILSAYGWEAGRIAAVQHCIRAHRFRDGREPPQTLEAKILFDADKLDAIGAIGVARAIAYATQAGEPFFAPASEEFSKNGQKQAGEAHSAYHEYLFKLRKLSERLYTVAARRMGEDRHQVMTVYFEHLAAEMNAIE